MITKIKKRDGREVPFNIEKIANAVFKSFVAAKENDALEESYAAALEVAEKVAARLEAESNHNPGVEEIQDAVESVLIASGYARAAKAYILYRAQRSRVREMNSRLMSIYAELTFKDAQDNDL
ncbi:MAG: anaerobic ribonucleoside triphosphate reductase, partial [Synergistaceae bacterium]|nr:anaerobic ribonucleoside triphosphate reductase [Synergistaceae bacterium]